MKVEQDAARLHLIDQVLDATTPNEIALAEEALDCWMQVHPDDLGMVDGFEQLSIMKDAARIKETEITHHIQEPAHAA